MPLFESETLTYERMKKMAWSHKCSCGANLVLALKSDTEGHPKGVLRCAINIEHSEYVRPFTVNQFNNPGYNMPGMMRRNTEMMVQKYGEEKTKQMVRIGGGNPIATLTQKGAAQMLELLYPEAMVSKSGQAAIVKGALICRDYGLNPAMDHIFMIKFDRYEGKGRERHKVGEDWSVVRGIKASRLICGREKSYGYIDDSPRIMTPDEQMRIYGEVDTESLVTICKLKDKDNNTFTGYGKWPRWKTYADGNKYANEPNGKDKGNSMFNMSCIRAERQALDKLNPGAMPADVDVVDERFIDNPGRVVVSEIKEEAKQIEATGQTGDETGDGQEPGGMDEPGGEPESGEIGGQIGEVKPDPAKKTEKAVFKTSAQIKTFGDLYEACIKQWPKSFKTSQDVIKEAGGNSQTDLTDTPATIYSRIFNVRVLTV